MQKNARRKRAERADTARKDIVLKKHRIIQAVLFAVLLAGQTAAAPAVCAYAAENTAAASVTEVSADAGTGTENAVQTDAGTADTQAADTQTGTGHVHTAACYPGTLHVCTGSPETGGGCYTQPGFHTHTAACYSHTCTGTPVGSETEDGSVCPLCGWPRGVITVTCPVCGASVSSGTGCLNPACPQYAGTPQLTHAALTDAQAVSQGILICGKTEQTPEFIKTCGKESGHYYDASGKEVKPQCGNIVTGIEPVNSVQAGNSGPDLAVKVKYLDGHTEKKTAHSSDFEKGRQYISEPVTLIFTGQSDAYGNVSDFTAEVIYTGYAEPDGQVTAAPEAGSAVSDDSGDDSSAPEYTEISLGTKQDRNEKYLTYAKWTGGIFLAVLLIITFNVWTVRRWRDEDAAEEEEEAARRRERKQRADAAERNREKRRNGGKTGSNPYGRPEDPDGKNGGDRN